MGLLTRIMRKDGEIVPSKTDSPVPDDGGWRLWAAKGYDLLSQDDAIGAVENWCQAIDRFDGNAKQFGKFCDDVEEKVLVHIAELSGDGRFEPTHLMADLDLEVRVKLPEMEHTPFVDRIFYGMKEHIDEALGPEMTVSMYTAAAYSVLGGMRYAPDLGDVVERCREASRLASSAATQAGSYPRSSKGRLKPSEGKKYLEGFVWYFDTLADRLKAAIDSHGGIGGACCCKAEYPYDMIDPLSASLEQSCCLAGAGMFSRGKYEKACIAEFDRYISMYFDRPE
ncbi:MAG: hypothetical protein MJZ68_02120 [archaeon]|nr:hypothetical protein [archaeon]